MVLGQDTHIALVLATPSPRQGNYVNNRLHLAGKRPRTNI